MKLPPLLPKLPPAPVRADVQRGEGFMQLMLDAPDDVHARLAFASEGVSFGPKSLIPTVGVMHAYVNSGGKYVYRYRA